MSPRGLVGKPLTFFFNKSDLPLLIEGYAFFFFNFTMAELEDLWPLSLLENILSYKADCCLNSQEIK